MSANWDAIEAAFYTWLTGATGLPVIFANQSEEQPAGDYCAIKVELNKPTAPDYVWKNYSGGRSAGAEIELQVVSEREVALTVQGYTAAEYGSASARQKIQRAQMSLRLPSQQALFVAAGISVFDVQDVQDVPSLLETDFQGRALFRLRFYVRDTLSEFTTWIETVTPPVGTFT